MSLRAFRAAASWDLPACLAGLALYIADCENSKTGECSPSIGYLYKKTKNGKRAVQTALRKLEDLGVIETVARHDYRGGQVENGYTIKAYGSGEKR